MAKAVTYSCTQKRRPGTEDQVPQRLPRYLDKPQLSPAPAQGARPWPQASFPEEFRPLPSLSCRRSGPFLFLEQVAVDPGVRGLFPWPTPSLPSGSLSFRTRALAQCP